MLVAQAHQDVLMGLEVQLSPMYAVTCCQKANTIGTVTQVCRVVTQKSSQVQRFNYHLCML